MQGSELAYFPGVAPSVRVEKLLDGSKDGS